jgi:hypothetical protein
MLKVMPKTEMVRLEETHLASLLSIPSKEATLPFG